MVFYTYPFRNNFAVISRIRINYTNECVDTVLGFVLVRKDVRQENEVVFLCYAYEFSFI